MKRHIDLNSFRIMAVIFSGKIWRMENVAGAPRCAVALNTFNPLKPTVVYLIRF